MIYNITKPVGIGIEKSGLLLIKIMKCYSLCLLFVTIFGISTLAQMTNQSVHQGDNVTHKWSSFLLLENQTSTVDFKNYRLEASDHVAGKIYLLDCRVSKSEALTAAFILMGGNYEIKKYGVATGMPNLIPYKGGAILYGYWVEKKHWEIFNLQGDTLIQHLPYRRFDVVKK